MAVATDSPSNASLDEIAKPPPGVVLPPREIKGVLEKTAGYVARNGQIFEDRIRQKELSNPKFSFLHENDAYHPYYLWRLDEVREGRGTAISAGRVGEETRKQPEKPKGPEPPPDFHFSARMPNINALDLEVVKLTALFVAKNGRSFATTLAQRESTKSQFDFLRPQHSLYQYFSRLVDQYTDLLSSSIVDGGKVEAARVAELELNIKDKYHALNKAKTRAEWVRFQEAQKAQKEEELENERVEYAQIDWHDFVVVETVVFDENDDNADLPPPTSLADLQSASLEQKANMSLAPHNMRIEEAMPGEEDYSVHVVPPPPPPPTAYVPPAPAVQTLPQHPPPTFTPPPIQAPPPPASAPTMRIRESTAPRAMRRKNLATAMCPNCKQQIPMDELEQHMKVELLDPQWREQRAKAESRYATTNLSTVDVATNLKRLASQRTDVFDPLTGQPVSEDEQARAKRIATAVEPNGVAGGTMTPPVNINDQIKSIHERFADAARREG